MTPKLKKIIIVILILILMFLGYAIFVKPDPQQVSLVDGRNNLQQDTRILGTQISQSLLRIEQIKLNKDIFTNPLYISLVDRGRPIGQEPVGRQNPFAPIGTVSTVQTQVIEDEEDTEEAEEVNL